MNDSQYVAALENRCSKLEYHRDAFRQFMQTKALSTDEYLRFLAHKILVEGAPTETNEEEENYEEDSTQ